MGRKRLYLTEEERKAAQRKSQRKWAEKNKNYQTEYYQANKEKIAAQQAEWRKNNKEKKAAYMSAYYQTNKEKKLEYRQNNKEKIAAYNAEYYATPKGRAVNLLTAYRQADKKQNRGECTLTAEWVIEHIFNEPCHYCGKTDWHELGCDRKDSSLPHTPGNCVPCCKHCNEKKGTTPYNEYMRLIGKIA